MTPTIPEQMSDALIDAEEIDFSSLNEVTRVLIAAGFRSSSINLYMDEAIDLAREHVERYYQ